MYFEYLYVCSCINFGMPFHFAFFCIMSSSSKCSSLIANVGITIFTSYSILSVGITIFTSYLISNSGITISISYSILSVGITISTSYSISNVGITISTSYLISNGKRTASTCSFPLHFYLLDLRCNQLTIWSLIVPTL